MPRAQGQPEYRWLGNWRRSSVDGHLREFRLDLRHLSALSKPINQSASLQLSPCSLWNWGLYINLPAPWALHPWREPIWPLFPANIQSKQKLKDLEFPLLIIINGREMLRKGAKIRASQISPKGDWKMPAMGSFRARRRPSATPGFLGSFSQKIELSRL